MNTTSCMNDSTICSTNDLAAVQKPDSATRAPGAKPSSRCVGSVGMCWSMEASRRSGHSTDSYILILYIYIKL